MKKLLLFVAALALLTSGSIAQTVTDIDGNVYDTIHIGTQIWTRPNLNVTHYLNGDPIPNVTDSAQWANLTYGAYCNYDNDSNNAAVYGKLYNWYAVNDPRGIAPLGYHVPTFEDWDTLQIFLGYDLVAGGKLKEIGTTHWMSPNTGASDEYDFTALPGGQRADSIYSGTFTEIKEQGYWSSSSEIDTIYPWAMNISYNSEGFTNWGASTRKSGFSIRLISDLPLSINNIDNSDSFKIYPNPAADLFLISYPQLFGNEVTITISDIAGKIIPIAIGNKTTASAIQKIEVNTSDFAEGVYLVQIQTEKFISIKKIVITK
ncbi:MAG: T9SS type A sorting domain-containing protein [Bacteroidetes bacterium]|nr:T9SS type A sorting domain-containing protein [Bacteroidota bacterium]